MNLRSPSLCKNFPPGHCTFSPYHEKTHPTPYQFLTTIAHDLKKDRDRQDSQGMTKTARRLGRPMKPPPPKGKRVSLGLKVTSEVKRHIDQAARASGRTQSQEAENLIERALQFDRVFKAMNTTLEQMERGNLRAGLQRLGCTPIRGADGHTLWAEPGHPAIKRGGFIPPKDDP
jgi:hypothetical protein